MFVPREVVTSLGFSTVKGSVEGRTLLPDLTPMEYKEGGDPKILRTKDRKDLSCRRHESSGRLFPLEGVSYRGDRNRNRDPVKDKDYSVTPTLLHLASQFPFGSRLKKLHHQKLVLGKR